VLDGSGEAFRRGLAGRPWFVKPNRREAEEVLGRRLTTTRQVIDAVRQLIRRGPQVVVVSRGEDGAVMGTAAERTVWIAEAPRVTVRSTVGAGDSLVAGFVAGWLRTKSLEEAFRLGIACGTATVLTPGTELCRAADVRRLVPRVRVRRLS
jgi:fructose-1-phosphate kinase PfkB-like protein